MFTKLIILSLMFLLPVIAQAQISRKPSALEKWASPVTDEDTLKTILFSGLGLTSYFYAERSKYGDPLAAEWSQSEPMGELATFGDYMGQLLPNLAYIGAAQYFGDTEKRNFMFETTLYTGLTVLILKHTVGERRPNGGDTLSFPSGHTATAFAFAGVVGIEHEWYWAVPAYAMAAIVGASRINDNAHHLHDVIAGATIGLAYAYGLNALRNTNNEEKSPVTLAPMEGGGMLNYAASF